MKPYFVVFKCENQNLVEPFHHIFDDRSDAESMAKHLALRSGKEHIVVVIRSPWATGNLVYRCTMPDGKPTIYRRPDPDGSKRFPLGGASLKISEAIAQARKDQQVVEEQEREFKRKQRRQRYIANKELDKRHAKKNPKIQQNDLDNKNEAPDNSLVNQQQEDKGKNNEARTHNSAASGEGGNGS